LLIPGDISEAVEQRLVSTGRLKAGSVLVVPHHGSASSSSKAFIDSISPRLAVISSGYLNRFNLPKDTVVDRYQSNGTRVMSTAECGAIRVTIAQNGKLKVQSARKNRGAIWRQKAGSSCQ